MTLNHSFTKSPNRQIAKSRFPLGVSPCTPCFNLLCLVAMMFALTGCNTPPDTSPSAGLPDFYPAPMNDPQISILSPELRPWLGFQPAIISDDERRPMAVEIPVRNLTNNHYLLEYRIIFHNARGVELTPIMGWEFLSLEPKQIARLKRRALSTDAYTYRLEVKWSR